MARPIRIDIKDGVYHVMCRGTERCDLFRSDADYEHFLDRLAEAQRRFRLCIYAYVLMKNHFHLIVCTPEANLSAVMQWLKVSYSMWFNAKYQRVGPLFQGRFKGILVDQDERWLLELSLYVHLNPVRVHKLGLGKRDKKAEALGWKKPAPEEVVERMKELIAYKWSSYPYYVGYRGNTPGWLSPEDILHMTASQEEYRAMTERKILHGIEEEFLLKLQDRLALGSQVFVQKIRDMCRSGDDYERLTMLRRKRSWMDIVEAVEKRKGMSWGEFNHIRGDWGKAAVFYLSRIHAGMTLKEIGDAAGGMKYPAVSQLVKRFEKRLSVDSELQKTVHEIEEMLNIQT
ncbi:MAG: transposase [Pontiellaceae bacterium]|nr:transposase [Pontiellaceae bacterium]